MSARKAAKEYTAESLRELTGLEPIRQSPSQYIGDTLAVSAKHGRNNADENETLTAGGFHLFVEMLGNASDEATNFSDDGKPFADCIEVRLHADQSITVTDNGRGVPPDVNKTTGKTGLEMTYLTMNAGGKFKERTKSSKNSYVNSQGLHGIGACCVAALSDRLDVTVWRNGKEYRLCAKEGIPGRFDGTEIRAKFTPAAKSSDIVEVLDDTRSEKTKLGATGTSVHWHPDPKIWGGTDIPWFDIIEYVKAQSYMAPSCVYRIIDETKLGGGSKAKPKITEYHHENGIVDMISEKTEKKNNLSPIISFDIPTTYMKNVVIEDEDGNMSQQPIEYDCTVKAALRWTSISGNDIEGYANGVHCAGKHVDGLRRGLSRGVGDWIKNNNILTKQDEKKGISPNIDDITDGMVAVIEVLLEDKCDFHGQTKDVLGNAEVLSCVSDIVKDEVSRWFSSKKNSANAKKVAKQIVENARLRSKQKAERENAKKIREAIGGLGSKPAKLLDCRNEGPGTEIIVCEGDSAGGTIKKIRDANWQSCLPIKGVSANAYGAKEAKILANAEFSDFISAMRVGGVGKNCDLSNRRYQRVGIYTDADEDGNYIRALFLVFIYTQLPGLIESGNVFAGCPPLYYITCKSGARKGQRVPMMSEAERDGFITDYTRNGGKLSDLDIQRSKGLGEDDEADALQWLSPATRKIRVITVDDVEEARKQVNETMGMLFDNTEANRLKRRAWIDETFTHDID